MYIHIKTKVSLKIAFKIAWLLLIACAFVFLQIQAFPYLGNRLLKVLSVLLSVLLYGFIVYKTGLIRLLCDKYWVGTVQGRTLRKKTVVRGVVAHRGNTEDVMIAKWHVIRDGGEEIFLEYETGQIADDYYKAGDRVRHYKGAKLIIREHPSPDDNNLFCPLCGKMVMRERCSFCKIRFDAP